MFSIEIFARSSLGPRGTHGVGLPFVVAGLWQGGRTYWGYPKLLEIGTARMQTISSYNCQNEALSSTQFPFLPSNPPSYTRRQMFAVVCTTAVPANIYSKHYNTRIGERVYSYLKQLYSHYSSYLAVISLYSIHSVPLYICRVWWRQMQRHCSRHGAPRLSLISFIHLCKYLI